MKLDRLMTGLDEMHENAREMCGVLPDEISKEERARLQAIRDDIRRILVAVMVTSETGELDLETHELVIVPKE